MKQGVSIILGLILWRLLLQWWLGTVTRSPSSQDSDSIGTTAFYNFLHFSSKNDLLQNLHTNTGPWTPTKI